MLQLASLKESILGQLLVTLVVVTILNRNYADKYLKVDGQNAARRPQPEPKARPSRSFEEI